MLLRDLLTDFPLAPDLGARAIRALQLDSRKVEEGDLFFALAGSQVDGATFAPMAAERGAAAIVVRSDAEITALHCPVIRVDDPSQTLARAAAIHAGAQPRLVAGVTGTSGKSSVVNFLRQIWQTTGLDAASVGTIGVSRADGIEYGGLTTPDAISLHATLAALTRDGVEAVALEASSHGIHQRRLDGIVFAAAGFTNLGRDHMDYHPTVEDYFAAKMRLFETLLPENAPAVIDADGAMSDRAIEVARASGRNVITVGEEGETFRLVARDRRSGSQLLTIRHEDRDFQITLPLVGDFQASNALVAAGLAIATGTDVDAALGALECLTGTPGRMEQIGASANGAHVFVDYAHKPDALAAVLTALRPFTAGKLVCVFGCGGDRDPGKRAIMGEISTRLADVTIVTDDNPRTEDPASIRAAIMTAAPGAREIGDRRDAIHQAIRDLEAGDILVIAGKGHETGQIVGSEVLPFSDQDEARSALKHLETRS